MSHSAMSMPEIVWVSVPPCPIQNVFWWSFSVTRIGSTALSPITSDRSTASAASTSRASVKTLPTPMRPSSVFTITSAWTESSALISFVQPPLGDLPNRPRLSTDLILTSSP
jgi:hypothetical protein